MVRKKKLFRILKMMLIAIKISNSERISIIAIILQRRRCKGRIESRIHLSRKEMLPERNLSISNHR
jgi:hypothetical protein